MKKISEAFVAILLFCIGPLIAVGFLSTGYLLVSLVSKGA